MNVTNFPLNVLLLCAWQRSELPSSPAALLRHINSQAYRQAQQDMLSRVSSSYEVDTSNPCSIEAQQNTHRPPHLKIPVLEWWRSSVAAHHAFAQLVYYLMPPGPRFTMLLRGELAVY